MLPVSGAEQLKTSEAKLHAAHLFGAERVFEIGQAGAVELAVVVLRERRQEQVPQALGLGLRLQLLDDRHDLPAILAGGVHLLVVSVDRGIDMLVHEGDDAVAPMPLPVRKRRNPWGSSRAS